MPQSVLLFTVLLSFFGIVSLVYQGRMFSSVLQVSLLISGFLFSDLTWGPPAWGEEPPPQDRFDQRVYSMTTKQLADWGETIIFGEVGGLKKRGVGKGQCPLCHTFNPGDIGDRAPNLYKDVQRAEERIKEPRYLHPDTVQHESFPGSGRATTADEYIAESHVCPSCYVVQGYGERGTNDRKSPMAADSKPPISLSIEEMIAVHTWLYVHDGVTPPSPQQIRADHEKFIPKAERLYSSDSSDLMPKVKKRLSTLLMTSATDTPEQMVMKMGCVNCHQIPGVGVKTGVMGPILIEKLLAPKRLHSPEYQARVKAGNAHARTAKEYVIESIVSPDDFITKDFVYNSNPEQSVMYPYYGRWFTYEALQKLADYLLTLDCEGAKKDGLSGPSSESVSEICDHT